MLSLIKNELGKILVRASSWIYILIVLSVVLAAAGIQAKFTDKPNSNWREELESEIAALEEDLQTAEEEWEKELIIYEIETNKAYLAENINPDTYSNWHFMNDTVFVVMILMVVLFTAIVASASVSAEFSSGTIKQLLIRPHFRWQVLFSKYLAVLMYSLIMLAALIIFGFLIGTLFFGAGDFNTRFFESDLDSNRTVMVVGKQFFLKVLYFLPGLIIITTISFMLSTLFKNQSLAVGVSIFVLLVSSTLGGIIIFLAEKYTWAKFLIFPYLDLTVFATQDTILQDVNLPMALLILAVYYVIFMVLTFTIFQKRDITV